MKDITAKDLRLLYDFNTVSRIGVYKDDGQVNIGCTFSTTTGKSWIVNDSYEYVVDFKSFDNAIKWLVNDLDIATSKIDIHYEK